MSRNPYRMLALVLVFAVMLGLTMAMLPAPAQAHGNGGAPSHHWRQKPMNTGSAYFRPNRLPRVVERDFGDDCVWWRYELRGGRYVRTYCPCRYGDQKLDYSPNRRAIASNWYR